MIRVVVESPFAAPDAEGLAENREYLRACMRECLERGEAPFASHRLYTECLDDKIPAERALGIEAGFEWGRYASKTVVYIDRGVSNGMRAGIAAAKKAGRIVEYRRLGVPGSVVSIPAWEGVCP